MIICNWCGGVHGSYVGELPRFGDIVILHAPFFSHPKGDKVLNVLNGRFGDKRIWVRRDGTSGVEETPLDCVKSIERR